jgi:hypothetical protein
LIVAVGLSSQAGAQSTTNFTVTNSGAMAYRVAEFGTVNNPTIPLVRGSTYNFNVSTPGHPFFISTVANSTGGPAFTTGVTNSMVTAGTLTFVVPMSAPDTLFYQCSVHTVMSGMLTITSPPPPVPTFSLLGATILGAAVLLGGMALLRRRNTAAT